MNENLNLTHQEIIEVTGKIRPSVQYRMLCEMGIPAKKRSDGIPIVCRQVYLEIMGVTPVTKHSISETPDFSAFRM